MNEPVKSMNENNSLFQVPREKREFHLQFATGQHIKLVKEGLQEQVNDLKKRNEERCEALQNKVNAVEEHLEKEVQDFKVESQSLHAGFEEKRNDSKREFEQRVNALEGQKEVQILKVELKTLEAAFEEKNYDLRKKFEESLNDLRKKFEGRVKIIQKGDKERCENEMNALRRKHDAEFRILKRKRGKEVDALQKEIAACKKKVDSLENELNTKRNELAVNEQEASNQTRELEERVRNITDQVNWNTKFRGLKAGREKVVDTLQKERTACEKKVDALETGVLNANRNERAANEEEAYSQTREFEEMVRNTTDQVNLSTKLNIIASAVGLGAIVIFAIVKFLV